MSDSPASLGQEKINSYFDRSVSSGRIPHALIISGPRSSGKLQLAMQFALCCLESDKDFHPDIKVIDLYNCGSKYIETVRKQMIENIYLSPYSNRYKFYIITGAQLLPVPAQNAILKSLEEPPEYASVIMLTDNPGKLLPTIRSRSVILHVQPVEDAHIAEYLKKSQNAQSDRIKEATALSLGIPTRAASIIEDETYIDMAYSIASTVSGVVRKKNHIPYMGNISLFKEEVDKFLELMELFMRDVVVYKSVNESKSLIFPYWEQDVTYVAHNCSFLKLGRILESLRSAGISLRANVGKDVLTELIMLETGGDD